MLVYPVRPATGGRQQMTQRDSFKPRLSFNRILDAGINPLYTEIVSPTRFVEIWSTMRKAIRSTRFLPPKLGDEGFGRVLIVWKVPVFAVKDLRQGFHEQSTL